jgi:hypothetical protein
VPKKLASRGRARKKKNQRHGKRGDRGQNLVSLLSPLSPRLKKHQNAPKQNRENSTLGYNIHGIFEYLEFTSRERERKEHKSRGMSTNPKSARFCCLFISLLFVFFIVYCAAAAAAAADVLRCRCRCRWKLSAAICEISHSQLSSPRFLAVSLSLHLSLSLSLSLSPHISPPVLCSAGEKALKEKQKFSLLRPSCILSACRLIS